MRIEFFGVRGSCPCPESGTCRYGGNTACVELSVPGEAPLLLDLGTGLRAYGLTQPTDGSFAGTALLTHVHWDHVQGLPFFTPADRPGATFDIYGPAQEGCSLAQALGDLVRPPFFPVTIGQLRGRIAIHDLVEEDLVIGGAKVGARWVPHPGPTLGYRISWGGVVVTYISDLQAPADLTSVSDSVLDLAADADVLVLDSQYTVEEFAAKATWGHCTIGYSLRVAVASRARTLVLFHHDPSHDDDRMDELLAEVRAVAGPGGPEVLAAYEGMVIER